MMAQTSSTPTKEVPMQGITLRSSFFKLLVHLGRDVLITEHKVKGRGSRFQDLVPSSWFKEKLAGEPRICGCSQIASNKSRSHGWGGSM